MKYRLILAAIVVGLLGLVSAFSYAQNLPAPTETPAASSVIQQDIFVRGGPGRDYLPVGKLLAEDHVRPLSRNAQGDWVLIVYGKSFGWIRRDLAFWVENIDILPIIDVANLTPSPVLPTTPTGTPLLLPTDTPTGNWVQLNGDAQSGFVRAGPGRTYLRLGQLLTGDSVEPVSRNADGSWIMIRYKEGFGWVARNLVRWVDNLDVLPVVELNNLTPSATFTATNTATPTATATSTTTSTLTPTVTFTATASFTPTTTPTVTSSSTPEPTVTPKPLPSATETEIPTSTSTSIPTETLTPTVAPSSTNTPSATPTETATLVPTVVPTSTLTFTPTTSPSDTPTAVVEVVILPSATVQVLPTLTATATSTNTPIPPTNTTTPLPTNTMTATATATSTPSPTPMSPTYTATPSVTFTKTVSVATPLPASSTPTPISSVLPLATTLAATKTVARVTQAVTPTATVTPDQTHVAASGINAITPTPNLPTNNVSPNNSPAPEVLIAGFVLIAILAYAVLYWRGISGSERYASGFVIETCPVCQRGHLIVESRHERLFGIPRARHSVRCTACRSVLREVSNEHWRYAVDPIENPDLYQRLNGGIIDEQTLVDLAQNRSQTTSQPSASSQSTPPDFVDDP